MKVANMRFVSFETYFLQENDISLNSGNLGTLVLDKFGHNWRTTVDASSTMFTSHIQLQIHIEQLKDIEFRILKSHFPYKRATHSVTWFVLTITNMSRFAVLL